MDAFVEQSFPSTLGRLLVPRVLLDTGHQAHLEDRLAIRLGIAPPSEIELRPSQLQPCELGHPLERFEPLWEQHGICFIDRGDWQGSQHIQSGLQGAIVSPFGEDFLDSRVMDGRLAIMIFWYRQALPLHTGVEHP